MDREQAGGDPGEDVKNFVRKAVPSLCADAPLGSWGQRYHCRHVAEGPEGWEAQEGPGSRPTAQPALPHQAAFLGQAFRGKTWNLQNRLRGTQPPSPQL